MPYTKEDIIETCDEINRQWNYLLIARAAFPARFVESLSGYESPPFYQLHGIHFKIEVAEPFIKTMQPMLQDIGGWINENFIIRFFGILDGKGFIKEGILSENCYIKIVKLLRNQVGAHTKGYRKPGNKEAKEATKLIEQHLDQTVMPADLEQFNLAIDTVLLRLKEGCIEFVQSLE